MEGARELADVRVGGGCGTTECVRLTHTALTHSFELCLQVRVCRSRSPQTAPCQPSSTSGSTCRRCVCVLVHVAVCVLVVGGCFLYAKTQLIIDRTVLMRCLTPECQLHNTSSCMLLTLVFCCLELPHPARCAVCVCMFVPTHTHTHTYIYICAQVIEDTVSVVQHVRKEREVPAATPNIVVGGSYGELGRWQLVGCALCCYAIAPSHT